MNERHPSGYVPDYDAFAYDAYSTGVYPTVGTTYAEDATGTYAYIPQQPTPYDQSYAYGSGYAPGYDQSAPQQPQTPGYDTGAYATGGYTTDGYGTGLYEASTHDSYDPYAYVTNPAAATGPTYYDTGTYDVGALWQNGQQANPDGQTGRPGPTDPLGMDPLDPLGMDSPGGQPAYPQQQDWDSGAYPTYGYGYGYGYDASGDTGIYEQVPSYETPPQGTPMQQMPGYQQAPGYEQAAPYGQMPSYETPAQGMPAYEPEAYAAPVPAPAPAPHGDTALLDLPDELDELHGTFAPAGSRDDEPVRHDFAADEEPVAARSRRRKPAKRSALLTVGVPSVAVMGVAAVGAAALGGVGMAQDSHSSADKVGNAPTTQLDRQLSGVSRDADDFATRANRAQERVDLKDRQAAARKAKEEAAARKEALRPKYVLPVTQKGLSAYFGQSGEHWMALHTGIDFPVQVGTPVHAVTDGTVRTQWNSSYGNMAIVTAPDGTETWYCHLSSTKIRSGKVQAGDVIAYSGNTGNTTGPHLHLEVRPHGGQPIDPLPWLLAHGLDPR